MTPFTGDYIKHLEDSKWKTNYYTFTPCSLTSGEFYKMDEELAAILSSAHRMLGLLEGMIAYLPDKESIKTLLLLQESYYCRLIDYPAPSFYNILAGKSSAKTDIARVNAISLAYEYSSGKVFTASTLSEICSIALYGAEMKNEIEVRKKQRFLHNIATNLKIYNPTAPEHILPAIADISTFLIHNETTGILIKAALIHYQFETIYPYECYNKILGRIIVPTILWNADYKAAPYLGLSKFLFYNKNEYFDSVI